MIRVVDESVFRGEDGNPDALVYSLPAVAPLENGAAVVTDRGYNRVRVFGADGYLLRAFGRGGQAPGELSNAYGVATVDDLAVVVDAGNSRLSVWNLAGEYLRSVAINADRRFELLAATDKGKVFARTVEYHQDGAGRVYGFGELDLNSGSMKDISEVGVPVALLSPPGSIMKMTLQLPAAEPSFAVARSGEIYVTAGNEYQVVAYDDSGAIRWALTVPWEREPINEDMRQTRIENAVVKFGDQARDLSWPKTWPAISHISVDGEGRLYVYPWISMTGRPALRPVDVYTSDGNRIFSGFIEGRAWSAARDAFVYGYYVAGSDNEWRVARWRLRFP